MELYRVGASSPVPCPRTSLQLPVRYRIESDRVWHSGTTENVSRSGALIRVETDLPLSAHVHLVFKIPARVLETAPCEVVGIGTVCRLGKSSLGQDVVGIRFEVVAVEALEAAMVRMSKD